MLIQNYKQNYNFDRLLQFFFSDIVNKLKNEGIFCFKAN